MRKNLIAGKIVLILIIAFAIMPAAFAELANRQVLYVDNKVGSTEYDGLAATPVPEKKSGPCATITQALKKAQQGAVISISNTGIDYRERVEVSGKNRGTPGAPLVIDGHGATVSGLLKVEPKAWNLLKDDIYWFRSVTPEGKPGLMPNSNWLGFLKHSGWFTEKEAPEIFFVNGKNAPNVLKFEDMPPGGFFYDTMGKNGPSGRVYFRLPAGSTIDQLTLEFPLNEGVFINADYVVVRNLQSKYSQDDGFAGFWGYGVTFENCNGSFNCDQGLSMHGNSVTIVDGGLFERNGGMGVVDVMSCNSIYRNVVVRNNLIGGVSGQGNYHSFRNSQIYGNAGGQIGGNFIDLDNCFISGGWQGVGIKGGHITRCTIVKCGSGVTADSGGTVTISNCIIQQNKDQIIRVAQGGLCKVANSLLGMGILTLDKTRITKEGWDEAMKENKYFADNILDAPALEGPLFQLPADSPYAKKGPYGSKLQEYTEWKAVE